MSWIVDIAQYQPANAQEEKDRHNMLSLFRQYGDGLLFRENEIAHFTSSAFILNEALNKVLMVHHTLRDTWAWTGGHVDGSADFLQVALREAQEETGVSACRPIRPCIASLDILPMFGHVKRGRCVSAHLHLSVAFLLTCSESEVLRVKPDENTAVAWLGTDVFTREAFVPEDVYLYNKLIKKARRWGSPR